MSLKCQIRRSRDLSDFTQVRCHLFITDGTDQSSIITRRDLVTSIEVLILGWL